MILEKHSNISNNLGKTTSIETMHTLLCHEVNINKIGWLAIKIIIMYPGGGTCLPTDCFSKQALEKSNSACWSNTKQISSSSSFNLI